MPEGQSVSVEGSGNIVVQATGDHFNMVIGQPHLVLTLYAGRSQLRTELDLLEPYARSTPLVGRDDELGGLRNFLKTPEPIRVRVITGGGGSGKTRLALELCHDLEGWSAGFVTRDEVARFFAQQNLAAWSWQRPTLVVVDYAAEHAVLLGRWLDELTARKPAAAGGHPLRLLLLERTANAGSGWWPEVFRRGGWTAGDKQALLDPREPEALRPLPADGAREKLLAQMLARLNIDPASVLIPSFRQQLATTEWAGDALYLMMAATSLKGGASGEQALALRRTDLAIELARREAGRIRGLAQPNVKADYLLHLSAVVTLAQGVSRDALEAFAATESAAAGWPSGGDPADVAERLHRAMPRSDDDIASIQPDLIGEALVVALLRGSKGGAAVLRAWKGFGSPVVEAAVRCAMDFGQADRTPLDWLSAMVNACAADAQRLADLDRSLPHERVVLRDEKLSIATLLHKAATCSALDPETLARAAHGLAIARAMLGQREAALEAAQEAVTLNRKLAHQRPEMFEPDLTMSLNTLANVLSNLNRRETALGPAQEAVALCRKLAQQRPEVFEPDLAASLNNLSSVLGGLNRREPALDAAKEAVALCRKLASHWPDVFAPRLAKCTSNLANRLSDLNEREPALAAAQKAVAIRKKLAQQQPDEFEPELAESMNNVAAILVA